MNPQHFGNDLADIRIRIQLNPEIWIPVPDHFWLTFYTLADVCTVWALSSLYLCQRRGFKTNKTEAGLTVFITAEPFSHGPGTLRCLQMEMATYRHWSVSLWRDPDDVSHCRILSPDKTEWRLISATFCGWRCCFVADQLWLMKRIREEDHCIVKVVRMKMMIWHVHRVRECEGGWLR